MVSMCVFISTVSPEPPSKSFREPEVSKVQKVYMGQFVSSIVFVGLCVSKFNLYQHLI